MNNPQKLSPPVYLIPKVEDIDGKKIIYLQIPESSQVHSTVGKIFDRNYDGDFNITGNHKLVEDLYLRKSNSFTESVIYKYLTLSDLRPDLISRVRKLASIQRSGHPWTTMTDDELLKSAKMYRKDFKTGEEGFTLAAALLFGKDEVIHNILPAYKTDALVRVINTDRFDDRIEVRTNLIESYDVLMDFIRKHLPDPFFMEGDQRISIRDRIFREVVANTLIHREYLNSFPAKLIIEEQQVTVENWNRPFGHGLINPSNFYTHPKNPNIMEVFKQIGRADELGSGVRNVFKYGKLYGSAEPVFEEGDVFKAIISLPKGHLAGKGKFSFGMEGALTVENDTRNDELNKLLDTINDTISDTIKIRYQNIIKILIKSPGLRANNLAGELKVSDVTIRRDMQKLFKQGIVEFKGSKKTGGYYLSFWKLSDKIASDLQVESLLQQQEQNDLMQDDLFQVTDKLLVSELCRKLSNGSWSLDETLRIVKARENKYWYSTFQNFYDALKEAASFLAFVKTQLPEKIESFTEGIENYVSEWYKADQYYRKFIQLFRKTNQNRVLKPLAQKIEKVYSNHWLLSLNNEWQAVVNRIGWRNGILRTAMPSAGFSTPM
jgi:predicted HTH transcriptional regulator